VLSNISGTPIIYSCGGGGGINDNELDNEATDYTQPDDPETTEVNEEVVVNGFGSAGCVGGGRGSNLVVDSRVGTGRNNYFNGTTPVNNCFGLPEPSFVCFPLTIAITFILFG
jgi:hypothetical protein